MSEQSSKAPEVVGRIKVRPDVGFQCRCGRFLEEALILEQQDGTGSVVCPRCKQQLAELHSDQA
jgi:hypothetical protein